MERLTVIPIWKKKGLRTLGLNRKIWTNFKRNFKQKSRGWPYISNIKNGSMNKMKQEKSSPTWRKLYATHIFAKFLDFGQKYYQSSTLSCRATAKFGFLDSAQRKIGCLNLTKLERNLKPAERKPDKHNCKAMLPLFASSIQIYKPDNPPKFFCKLYRFRSKYIKRDLPFKLFYPLSCFALT